MGTVTVLKRLNIDIADLNLFIIINHISPWEPQQQKLIWSMPSPEKQV